MGLEALNNFRILLKIQRGVRDSGSGPIPPKNQKNIGFLSNTGSDSLEKSQHSMLGHHQPTSVTPLKPSSARQSHLNGVSLVG